MSEIEVGKCCPVRASHMNTAVEEVRHYVDSFVQNEWRFSSVSLVFIPSSTLPCLRYSFLSRLVRV